jgi:hypothetical protein
MLHIKKEGEKVQRRPFVMTFADAIERYGSRMEHGGLVEAFKRARKAFHGQLEQHLYHLHCNDWCSRVNTPKI